MMREKSSRSSGRNRLSGLPIPGVVEHDVEAAETVDREVHERLHLLRIADVGLLEGGGLADALATSSPPSASMSAMTTLAPSATSSSAVAWPIPPAPPVTIATLPASSCVSCRDHTISPRALPTGRGESPAHHARRDGKEHPPARAVAAGSAGYRFFNGLPEEG